MIEALRNLETSWQWQNPKWLRAWIKLVCEASPVDDPEKGLRRGQLWLSIRGAAEHLNLSATETWRFIDTAEANHSILWDRGSGGKPGCAGNRISLGTITGTVSSRITICDYDQYCAVCKNSGTITGTELTDAPRPSGARTHPKKQAIQVVDDDVEVEKKPKKRTLVDEFHDMHLEVRGFKPHISGARDTMILKRVLNTCGSEEELLRRMREFLYDPMEFMDKPAWTLPFFEKRIDRYASQTAEPEWNDPLINGRKDGK